MQILLRYQLFVLALATSTAFAASSLHQVVGERAIDIAIPDGFVDASGSGQQLPALAAALTMPNIKVLAVLITPDDANRLRVGTQPRLDRYLLVKARAAYQNGTYSPQAFTAIKDSFLPSTGGIGAEEETANRTVKARAAELARLVDRELGTMAISGSRVIRRFDPSPLSGLVLIATKTTIGTETRMVIGAVGTALTQGKVVDVYVYSTYRGPEDVEWVLEESTSWVRSITGEPTSVQPRQLPSAVDLKAAYCVPIVKGHIAYWSNALASMPGMLAPEAKASNEKLYRGIITKDETDLSRLQAYLTPRIPYLDETAIKEALKRGEEDSRQAREDSANCTWDKKPLSCSDASDAISRTKMCNFLTFLPF